MRMTAVSGLLDSMFVFLSLFGRSRRPNIFDLELTSPTATNSRLKQ
jgi:hypothetical protein